MAKKAIPEDIRTQVNEMIDRFNQDEIGDPNRFFVPRYRGLYLYLDRRDWHLVSERGRLKYTGAMNTWEFSIFKYSSERYDPDEWLFPGSQHLNGTIDGALKACVEAYP